MRVKRRFDRVRLGDGHGGEFEIFDPPLWRLDRWFWWLAVWRRNEHGTISIVVDGGVQTFRCRRVG